MKKFYTLLIALVALNITAFAADKEVIINVTAGANRVDVVVGEEVYNGVTKTLINGENKISLPEDQYIYVTPKVKSDIIEFKDKDGDDVNMSNGSYYISSWSTYSPYTLTVMDESSYRTKSVTVKMDDCSKVSIVRADGKEFKPSQNTVTIPYSPVDESILTIKPRSYDGMIYKVSVNGVDVKKSSDRFKVNLVDNSDSEPVYVENIDVTANFPEGLKFKTVITLDGPKEMISYIKVNDVNVADIDACLTAEGFEANPGETIAIGYNSDYKIEEVTDNGDTKYAYSQLTIEQIDCDHNVNIKGHKYANYQVKFNITGAEGVIGSFGSSKPKFVENENLIDVSEKNNKLTVTEASGWYFESFTDANNTDYLQTSDYRYDKTVYLTLNEGDEYTIVAKKIRRDNQLVIYYDDFSSLDLSYFTTKFKNYDELPDAIVSGYNTINFRDEDGYFSVFASGTYDGFYAYKNDEKIAAPYDGAKYFEDENVAHKDVYKVFFINEPTVHNVTFTVSNNALDGYAVTKDILAEVNDFSTPVKAVGKTRFAIAPIARAADGIKVTVGDKEIEPVEGAYTFETEADTNVKVTTLTPSGIDSILNDADATADVYNLQGICIRRAATAADVKALPAGIYIVNGAKVAVK